MSERKLTLDELQAFTHQGRCYRVCFENSGSHVAYFLPLFDFRNADVVSI